MALTPTTNNNPAPDPTEISTRAKPSTSVFNAGEQATLGNARLRRLHANRDRLIRIGLPKLYDAQGFIPWEKGTINFFIGSSGNGKSSLFDWCALNWARRIKSMGLQDKLAVISVKTETVIETAYAKMVSPVLGMSYRDMLMQISEDKLDESMWQRMEDYGVKHASLPLWMVGHSSERPDPKLQIDIPLISSVISKLRTSGIDSYILLIDHLHDIADPYHRDPQERIEWLAAAVRDKLAHGYGVPTWVAAQANTEVHNRGLSKDTSGRSTGDPIPGEGEAMWAPGKVKQVGDNIITGTYLKKYRKTGESLIIDGTEHTVRTGTEYILTAAKQRDGDGGVGRLVWWRPDLNTFADKPLPDAGKEFLDLNREESASS
jgi:hypothetical protein